MVGGREADNEPALGLHRRRRDPDDAQFVVAIGEFSGVELLALPLGALSVADAIDEELEPIDAHRLSLGGGVGVLRDLADWLDPHLSCEHSPRLQCRGIGGDGRRDPGDHPPRLTEWIADNKDLVGTANRLIEGLSQAGTTGIVDMDRGVGELVLQGVGLDDRPARPRSA